MKALSREPRRPNLATIVGSGLAIAAAGSLLAFSSLAEQAGLQGLATGGIQPAQPSGGVGGRAITVPAPATAPPGNPRDALIELVRESIARTDAQTFEQPVTIALRPAAPRRTPAAPEPQPPDRIESRARVTVAAPDVSDDAEGSGGPPYGHAYGHYKKRSEDPKPPKAKKHAPKPGSSAPVYAREAGDDRNATTPPPPKMKRVEKAPTGNGKGNGKAKGHAKHAHKGKGKGHSKHGG